MFEMRIQPAHGPGYAVHIVFFQIILQVDQGVEDAPLNLAGTCFHGHIIVKGVEPQYGRRIVRRIGAALPQHVQCIKCVAIFLDGVFPCGRIEGNEIIDVVTHSLGFIFHGFFNGGGQVIEVHIIAFRNHGGKFTYLVTGGAVNEFLKINQIVRLVNKNMNHRLITLQVKGRHIVGIVESKHRCRIACLMGTTAPKQMQIIQSGAVFLEGKPPCIGVVRHLIIHAEPGGV